MSWLHTLASHFRPRKPRARDNRFAPRLEELGERVVPALMGLPSVQGGVLLVRTDAGNDTVSFTDRGLGSVRVIANGLDLNFVGVSTIRMIDLGGTNTVTYTAANTLGRTVVEMEYTGGPGVDRFQANVLNGLAANNSLLVDVVGGAGDDTLGVAVGGRLRAGSTLGVGMDGQLNWDVVGVDAHTHTPTVDAGARIWVALAGYTASGLENTPDSGNNVSFRYSGLMNGTLTFNVAGSSGADWVSANIWANAGSTGTIADGFVRGGGGADDVDYIVRGDAGLRFSGTHIVDGGSGYDRVNLARYSRAPNLFFDGIYGIEAPFRYDTDLR